MQRNEYAKEWMMLGVVILIMALISVGLITLRNGMPPSADARTRPQPDVLTEAEQLEAAQTTVKKYFAELHDGNYEQAVKHFDGSFLVLQALNPNDPTEDHVALLEDACEINGFLCLNVLEITSVEKIDDHTYQVEVVFQNEDGTAYSAESINSVDANPFLFTVIEEEGKFFVQDLPLAPLD
ncbi:MAG: hypothetical protein IAF02_09380 [Anaerolineae bacterium]|nr:hypothetical protein [Anaerolineae bacterium]